MISRWLASLIALFISHTVLAEGGKVGNGGGACVCRDSSNKIVRVSLLDLVGLNLLSVEQEYDDLFKTTLKRVGAASGFFSSLIESRVDKLSDRTEFVTFETSIPRTEDHTVECKQLTHDNAITCSYEQAALYTDDGILYIDQEIYESMDTVNRVALSIHEVLYAIDREINSAKNSDYTRMVVRRLFSSPFDLEKFSSVFAYRFGTDYSENILKISFSSEEYLSAIRYSIKSDNLFLFTELVFLQEYISIFDPENGDTLFHMVARYGSSSFLDYVVAKNLLPKRMLSVKNFDGLNVYQLAAQSGKVVK